MGNYWRECISLAADECGLMLTDDQLTALAESVEGAHETYGMYHGHDMIGRGESPEEQEIKKLKKSIDDRERWEAETIPCPDCRAYGFANDGWGRPQTCWRCDGKCRVDRPRVR